MSANPNDVLHKLQQRGRDLSTKTVQPVDKRCQPGARLVPQSLYRVDVIERFNQRKGNVARFHVLGALFVSSRESEF